MKENINNTMDNIMLSKYKDETLEQFQNRLTDFEASKDAIMNLVDKKYIVLVYEKK